MVYKKIKMVFNRNNLHFIDILLNLALINKKNVNSKILILFTLQRIICKLCCFNIYSILNNPMNHEEL